VLGRSTKGVAIAAQADGWYRAIAGSAGESVSPLVSPHAAAALLCRHALRSAREPSLRLNLLTAKSQASRCLAAHATAYR
jgi:hypothetical protein